MSQEDLWQMMICTMLAIRQYAGQCQKTCRNRVGLSHLHEKPRKNWKEFTIKKINLNKITKFTKSIASNLLASRASIVCFTWAKFIDKICRRWSWRMRIYSIGCYIIYEKTESISLGRKKIFTWNKTVLKTSRLHTLHRI